MRVSERAPVGKLSQALPYSATLIFRRTAFVS